MVPLGSWRILLLGQLILTRGDEKQFSFRRNKTAKLLAYLAYFHKISHTREVLAERFWPELEPVKQRNSLRVALSELRTYLEPPIMLAGSVIVSDRTTIRIQPGTIITDRDEFEDYLHKAKFSINSPTEKIRCLKKAISHYNGDLLPGHYEDWVGTERERLNSEFEAASTELKNLMATHGFPDDSLDAVCENDNESGQHGELFKQPRLPLQSTRFIGRQKEITYLVERLQNVSRDQVRLVTLTGLGGCGKTRLAIEVARQVANAFMRSIAFVSLEGITQAERIADAILAATGIPHKSNVDSLQSVIDGLSGIPYLLVLDNFDYLVGRGEGVIQTLVLRIPALTLLVTSREKLDLEIEEWYLVSSLPVPSDGDLSTESLLNNDSILLFIDRAQRACPSFQISPRNTATIADLCQRLEGIPLAIELAAAQAERLSLTRMLTELKKRFSFLKSSKKDLLPRHRSLMATLLWSYEMLPVSVQQVFIRLAVFHGGWTLKAAVSILPDAVCDPADIEQQLYDLARKSLIVIEIRHDIAGEAGRYRILETVREFCNELLENDPVFPTLNDRHAAYYSEWIDMAEKGLSGSESAVWSERFREEQHNLTAAFDWCRANTNGAELGLAIASAAFPLYSFRGQSLEALTWLEDACKHPFASKFPTRLALAKNCSAKATYRLANYAMSCEFYLEALLLYRQQENPYGVSDSLYGLGQIAFRKADYPEARRLHEECLSIREELEDKKTIADTLIGLGLIALAANDLVEAWNHFELARQGYMEANELLGVVRALSNLGNVARRQGNPELARSLFLKSLEIVPESQLNLQARSALLHNIGMMERALGNFNSAGSYYRQSIELDHSAGDRLGIVVSLWGFAALAIDQGDMKRAARLFGAEHVLREALGSPIEKVDEAEHDKDIEKVKRELKEGFERERYMGSLMQFEDAFRYVMEWPNVP